MTDKGSKNIPTQTPRPNPTPAPTPTHVPVRESWRDRAGTGDSVEKGHNTVPMQPKENPGKK